jgi:predicted transcriptional regulator
MAQIALSTKISIETHQKLEECREATQLPKSQIVENALQDYFDKMKVGK